MKEGDWLVAVDLLSALAKMWRDGGKNPPVCFTYEKY